MLVLTRHLRESLRIGDNVQLVVMGINGTRVRLGVSAPREIRVHREEIHERIKAEGLGSKLLRKEEK